MTSTGAAPFRLVRRKSSYTDLADDDASCRLMNLCDTANLDSFEAVCDVVKDKSSAIVKEIHAKNKLLVSNGHTTVFAPPEPEQGDDHGNLVLRTFSESVDESEQTVMTREFMVHLEQGNKVEVRERRKSKASDGTFEYNEMQKIIDLANN
ncbi:hypothetical protein SARC_03320 [Sphaeroforma arctica JP610]|uniref:Uncharacterized protein n=1 Tax=Sphaeroforma arctica JP610 TaxID=667725 RepID=A0A0L0G6E7_9EUKA|nr:hypothetical protein SARC_03320 [Sphaeroforma arctica JP610]KNC84456.1 hypothetical protein SARC_03320 [Sphaeroforma arctica JP610]|eukprot:XP_014158358.1 hypothetical protein SARC_03320 [Sphaeroforma arctica JP610]